MSIIALDFDGVIANTNRRSWNLIYNKWGINLTDDQFVGGGFARLLGLSIEDGLKLEDELWSSMDGVTPIPYAIGGIRVLADSHRLILATYRTNRAMVEEWLKLWGIFDFFDARLFINLGDEMRKVGYLLDDSPSKLGDLASFVVDGGLLLFTQPQNRRCVDVQKRFTGIVDWPHFMSMMGIR